MREAKTDLWSGLLMFIIGLVTTFISLSYELGTLASMGPGYFPLLAGISLMAVAALILLKGLVSFWRSKESTTTVAQERATLAAILPRFRVWFFISASMIAFVLLSQYVGLVVATAATVILAALADPANSLKQIVLLTLALTAFVVLVFHYILQIQIPLWVN